MRSLFNFPVWRNPFEEVERMRRQMDALFDNFGGTLFRPVRSGVFPLISLTEDRDAYYIRAELPGIANDAIDIQATHNSIGISGTRKIEVAEKAQYHRRERESGTFNRMITLPGEINPDQVDARLADGVLNVKLSKHEAIKPKQIAIK